MSEEDFPNHENLAVKEDGYVDKEELRRRLREHAKTIKIRGMEGTYEGDNPELEKKTKWQKKAELIEEKYKDKPKIAFHTLSTYLTIHPIC